MRAFGLILVVVGALALGYQGFVGGGKVTADPPAQTEAAQGPARVGWASPLLGGLALTSGLIC